MNAVATFPERSIPTGIDGLRQPPSSISAEQAVLGGLMLAPESVAKISDWLREDDFYRKDHRLIYRAVCVLANRGDACDAVTLGDWFAINGLTEAMGGLSYLVELHQATASAANIVAYAEIVAEKSRLRQAIDAGTQLTEAAYTQGTDSATLIANVMHGLSQLSATKLRGGLQTIKPALRDWFADLSARFESGDTVTGLPTPWLEINNATHGLQPGELIIVAARPNMGKSVLAGQLAMFSALRGVRTAVFSLEMTQRQVMRRAVSALGNVPHDWLMAPVGNEEYWSRVTDASAKLAEASLLLDDTPGLSIEQLSARARRANMQAPIGLLVIDHLHEMAINADHAVYDIGRNAGGLKALGKEFNCPVVCLAQLNRALTNRADKHPTMADLRASGDIEQKADVILFLHREDYYDRDTHLQGVVEVEIGKGRDVETGKRMHLQNRYDVMRLDDMDGPVPEPPPTHNKGRRGFSSGMPA
jgi:replicative DNA helicase